MSLRSFGLLATKTKRGRAGAQRLERGRQAFEEMKPGWPKVLEWLERTIGEGVEATSF
jgi:hypothetical protein